MFVNKLFGNEFFPKVEKLKLFLGKTKNKSSCWKRPSCLLCCTKPKVNIGSGRGKSAQGAGKKRKTDHASSESEESIYLVTSTPTPNSSHKPSRHFLGGSGSKAVK